MGLGIGGRAGVGLFDLRKHGPPRRLHAIGERGAAIRVGSEMMDHLLAMEKLGDDPCQATRKRVGWSLAEETLLHQACLFDQG